MCVMKYVPNYAVGDTNVIKIYKLGIVLITYNIALWEAEAEDSQIQANSEQLSEDLFQNIK